jgi:hypothetical protein
VFAAVYGIDRYRNRQILGNGELVGLLPSAHGTTFFADVWLLRKTGVLQALAGSAPSPDAEYTQFLADTHFDYTQDLDAIAGEMTGRGMYIAARGSFDWSALQRFATSHGGWCQGDFCSVPGSEPAKWISFFPVQSRVLGLAAGGDGRMASTIRNAGMKPAPMPSDQPVWLKFSPNVALQSNDIPIVARAFTIALLPASSVVLSIGPGGLQTKSLLELKLKADCPNRVAAERLSNQLSFETKAIRAEFAREQTSPDGSGGLAELLAAGKFEVNGNSVVGRWPVQEQLLKALQ